jgi:hypothetical protein
MNDDKASAGGRRWTNSWRELAVELRQPRVHTSESSVFNSLKILINESEMALAGGVTLTASGLRYRQIKKLKNEGEERGRQTLRDVWVRYLGLVSKSSSFVRVGEMAGVEAMEHTNPIKKKIT